VEDGGAGACGGTTGENVCLLSSYGVFSYAWMVCRMRKTKKKKTKNCIMKPYRQKGLRYNPERAEVQPRNGTIVAAGNSKAGLKNAEQRHSPTLQGMCRLADHGVALFG